MKCLDWLTGEPGQHVVVSEDTSVNAMVDAYVKSEWLRDLFVVDADERVVGWISGRRLASLLLGDYHHHQSRRELRERLADSPAHRIMNTRFETARGDELVEDVIHRLLCGPQEDLPVVDDQGKLVGIIHMRALMARVREGRLGEGESEDL